MKKNLLTGGALISGGLLAVTVFVNGELAQQTSPFWSSLIVHFAGIFGSWILWRWMEKDKMILPYSSDAPGWSYFGGMSGALVVVFANITVNSSIGLIGTFSLMILGQTTLALLFDLKGWFGMEKRKFHKMDFLQLVCILIGSIIIVNY